MATHQRINLAVIGMPGHGKSTFLNGLVGKRGAFAVGSGKDSCTQKVEPKSFDLEYNGSHVSARLIDTMGFPDPNPANAANYYDSVIACCNQELNAIVWLVRCERELRTLVAQYRVLMREFNNAQPPIILVVNGIENYEDDEEREERKDKDLMESFEFGIAIATAAGIQVQQVIPGAEKGDLKTKVKEQLAMALLGTFPRASKMKTFSQLQQEVEACKDADAAAALELQKAQEATAKIRQNIKDQNDHIETLIKVAAGTCWIPFVGLVSVAICIAKKADAEQEKRRLQRMLGSAEGTQRSLASNKDAAKSAAKMIMDAFAILKQALMC